MSTINITISDVCCYNNATNFDAEVAVSIDRSYYTDDMKRVDNRQNAQHVVGRAFKDREAAESAATGKQAELVQEIERVVKAWLSKYPKAKE